MSISGQSPQDLQFHPATPDRWNDLETLFGERGACAGCWCMWWRLRRAEWDRQRGEGNRIALKRLVDSGEVPGLLAYAEGRPAGWCSVAPREAFPALDRSRALKRIDAEPVWSVVCFFVARPFRRRGVAVALLRAAAEYARGRGATLLEGYPSNPGKRVADSWVYMGTTTAFLQVGFVEIARPSATRSIVRLAL